LLHVHFHVKSHLCQTVPLLPSATWQQHVTECGWEGSASVAISPASISDPVGQHNKMEGINTGVALVHEQSHWRQWDKSVENLHRFSEMLPSY